MIAYIKGEVAWIEEERIVLESGNIGYNIMMPASSFDTQDLVGKEVKIYTHLNVREDAMQLYGFLNLDELKTFRLLLGVNGIGPKAAIGILSGLTTDELRFAVLSDDVKTISKAPGIGKKTAYEMRMGDWSSDVCSSDLLLKLFLHHLKAQQNEVHLS